MGTISQTFKEYSSRTGSYSFRTADVSAANWATVAADYAAVTNAVNAIVLGVQTDILYAPVRNFTPDVPPPLLGAAQLGVRWDIFATDDVSGRDYLMASIPTANADAGGSSLLRPSSDEADLNATLMSNLINALSAVDLLTPEGNAVRANSFRVYLNQRRQYARP